MLEINNEDILNLTRVFDFSQIELEAEIRLLKSKIQFCF